MKRCWTVFHVWKLRFCVAKRVLKIQIFQIDRHDLSKLRFCWCKFIVNEQITLYFYVAETLEIQNFLFGELESVEILSLCRVFLLGNDIFDEVKGDLTCKFTNWQKLFLPLSIFFRWCGLKTTLVTDKACCEPFRVSKGDRYINQTNFL